MKSQLGVIGASGFIGQALLRALSDRHVSVAATARLESCQHADWLVYTLGDALTPLLAHLSNCQWVICLAGTAHCNTGEDVYYREAEHYQHLLQALLQSGKSVVYVSSVKAVDGDSAYARAKCRVEQYLQQQTLSSNWLVVRPALVYGLGMKGFLAQWCAALARNRAPRLPEVNNRRSLVSINNLLDALFFLMAQPAALAQIWTVTDAQTYSTAQLQRLLCDGLGKTWWQPALPLSLWRALARAGDHIAWLPFNSAHYQRLFGDADYQNSALPQLGFIANESFVDFAATLKGLSQ